MPKLASKVECTGCMACVDSCAKGALKFNIANDGHVYPIFEQDLCVNCGVCEKVCPVVGKFCYSKSTVSKAYASWSNNVVMRKNSASGGVFSAVAEYVVSLGGVVYGATICGVADVRHIRISTEEEIRLLQGSKYSQSNTSGVYKLVYNDLRSGNYVLFSGTGCQVAGLYSFLKAKKYNGKLLTIDIICGGVPSRLLIDKFLECEPIKITRIQSFRTKETGWKPQGFKYNLKVVDESNVIHDYSDKRNLVTTGFACEMTNRYSCYKCQYAGLYRLSDFTIGDFWGVKDYKEEHYNGVSVIIAHNQGALELLDALNPYLSNYPVSVDDVLKSNPRLVSVMDKRYKMPERRFLTWAFQNLNYTVLKKIYALDFSKYSPWMIYKIYRLLLSKFLR